MRSAFVDNMSATDEDNELRDLLVQTLESNGTLSKLRAQLSASVFLALEKQEPTQNKAPLLNTKLKDFLNTKDGHLAAGLVREFLEFFNMDFTEVVFDEESGMSSENGKRDVLVNELNLSNNNNNDPSKQVPLLSQALKQAKKTAEEPASLKTTSPAKTCTTPISLSQNCIAEARKRFDQYEKDHVGTIEKDDVTNIFAELFPDFHRSMLERFVYEECRDAEKRSSHSINFEEFLTMYKHLFEFCKTVVLRHESLTETETKTDSFLTFHTGGNRLPSLNTSPNKGVLNSHISTSFNKPEGNGVLKSDQMSWKSDWNGSSKPAKSPEPKSLSQHSSPRSNLLPTAHEEDPFFDDPFLPASSGLKTFGREDEDDLISPTKKNGSLYQAKPITVIPKQSKGDPVEMTNVDSSDDNSVSLPNSVVSDLDKQTGDLKFEDVDDDYDDDFHSEGKTPRTASHSDAPKSLNGGEEIEEELDLSQEADDLLKSEDSELADLTTDKTMSQPDTGFDYMEDVLSS